MALAAALLFALSCSETRARNGTDSGTTTIDGGVDGDGGDSGNGGEAGVTTAAVDLLFVIDNSGSMAVTQQTLIVHFAPMLNVLRGLPGGMPDLHLGVVSSDLGVGGRTDVPNCRLFGDGGRLQAEPRVPGCRGPRDRFISASARETVTNYDGTLEEAFACIAALGEAGCDFEQPLRAGAIALGFSGAVPPENAGFLRPDAHLAVYFISNEDDCSAPDDTQLFDPSDQSLTSQWGPLTSYRCNEFGHLCGGQRPPRMPSGAVELTDCHSAEDGVLTRVSELAAFFKSLKPETKLVIGALVGPTLPYAVALEPAMVDGASTEVPAVAHSCMSPNGPFANPGVRFHDFTDQFANGVRLPLCADSFSPLLELIAQKL